MKTRYYGKILVIGLLILLVGAVIGPNISGKTVMTETGPRLTDKNVEPLFTGTSYFILLSDYLDGQGQENSWAVQLRMDSALMVIECEYDAISLPLILDKWVEIRVEIDLDGDWMEIYYNGTFLHEKAWTATPNNDGSGFLNIAAVDLYANGASSVFYDDMQLEQVGTGVVWSDDFSAYTLGQDLDGDATDGGWKGWDNDPSVGAHVVDTQERSVPHSVDIVGPTDLVHEYSGYTAGQYVYTAYVYVPGKSPPDAPSIDGPTMGTVNIPIDYNFTSIDADGDDIAEYNISWGDGIVEILTGPFASGATQTATHTYTSQGPFTITARATDVDGMTSPDSTLDITIPRAKSMQFPLFYRFFQRFPNAFPILRQLLGL